MVSSYGDGTEDEYSTLDPVPPMEAVSFWFNHTYVEGSDTPYAAEFRVMDADEHPLLDWDTAVTDMTVNSPPTAMLSADPTQASTGETVAFDASGSSDAETETTSLQFRWDWTGDGVWDTDWGSSPEASHYYSLPGDYAVHVQVMDGAGLLSVESISVTVTGEAIPEFSMVLVPVAVTMLAVLLFGRAARRKT